MPNLSLIATVNTAGFDNLIASKIRLQTVLRKAAFNVEKKAKEIVVEKNIIDTGFLHSSIAPDFSNLPDLEVTITPAAEYWVHQEFGTVNQPARPFMGPALDNERTKFLAAVAEVL